MHVKKAIPEGKEGLASVFEITDDMLKKANFERVEHITLTMNVKHQRRGDLSVELISPSGMSSHLSTARRDDDDGRGYEDWTFMSVAHWGESGIGNWTVIVKDTVANKKTGSLTDWKLRLWGESIDSSKATLLPIPTEHDDDDHDVIDDHPAHTTSVSLPSHTPTVTANPSDHPDRPVNQKPTDGADADAASASPTTAPTPSTPASPSTTPSPEPENENLLPSIFPTFGVSRHTQLWIYGSLALILIFVLSLALYFYLARRRQQKSSRDAYEFEVLDDVDDREDDRRVEDVPALVRPGLDVAPLLAPEVDQGGFIVAHDDPGVRAADEGTAVRGRFLFRNVQCHASSPSARLYLV